MVVKDLRGNSRRHCQCWLAKVSLYRNLVDQFPVYPSWYLLIQVEWLVLEPGAGLSNPQKWGETRYLMAIVSLSGFMTGFGAF
jgi:hypothetical protein